MSMRHIHMHISMAIIAVNFFMALSPFLRVMQASYHTTPVFVNPSKRIPIVFPLYLTFVRVFPFFTKDVNIPQKACNLPRGTIQ